MLLGTNLWTILTSRTASRSLQIACARLCKRTRVKGGSLKAVTHQATCWKGHYFSLKLGSANLQTTHNANRKSYKATNFNNNSNSSSMSTTCTAWSYITATDRLAATISAFVKSKLTRKEMKRTGSNLMMTKSRLCLRTRSTAICKKLISSSTEGAGITRKINSKSYWKPGNGSNSHRRCQ